MDKPRHMPLPATPKGLGAYRSDAAAAQFWFEPSAHAAPDHITGREKFAGVALAGATTALATMGYYAIAGDWTESLPVVVLILFFTAIGIGFFLLRREGPARIADAELVAAMIAEIGSPALVSDREGHLVCANPAYRDFFGGRTPSPRKLLFEPRFAGEIRELLRAANRGLRAARRFTAGGEGAEGRATFATASPKGGYIVWTFAEDRPEGNPLAQLGNLEGAFHFLLDRFSAGLVIAEADGTMRYANPTALRLLELASRDLKGKTAAEAVGPDVLRERGLHLEWLPLKEGGESAFSFGLLSRAGEGAGAGEALKEFAALVAEAPIAIAVVDAETLDLEHLNAAAETLFRKFVKKPPRPGDNFLGLLPESHKKALRGRIEEIGRPGPGRPPFEFSFREGAGDVVQVFFGEAAENGKRSAILYLIDTSEVKRLEMQFVQAQKMQAVGQLAGGVAHDFNNLLTAIIGFCDLLLLRHKAGDQSFADLIQIKQNANRAADLIRQLLAFSRRQALHPRVLNVTEVLSDLSNLIRRLTGEKIKLRLRHGKDVGFIRADQSQIEQVIVNLAVNARDAMPKGGLLVIATEFVPAEAVAKKAHAGLEKKDYIRIRVEDTGAGIPKEFADKVFEPFFTTKELGKGTGLGLSTAYGIVTQTGGWLYLAEKEGKGAAFDIFLPALAEEEVKKELKKTGEKAAEPKDLTGSEVILFVEDEDPVRTFVSRALQSKGYKVLEADSGEAALEVLKTYLGPLDMLISDVVMPNMDGPSLARKIMEVHPHIKIILTSGYAEEGFHKGLDRARFSFIAKPFTLQALASRVRQVFEADANRRPGRAE